MSGATTDLADALKSGSWDEAYEAAGEIRADIEDHNETPDMSPDDWIDLLDGIEKVLQDI